jgi:predicted ATP-dependent serine protease
MRNKYVCKYCGVKTEKTNCICSLCEEKLVLIRRIKAMLMPYKISKDARAKQMREREKKDD